MTEMPTILHTSNREEQATLDGGAAMFSGVGAGGDPETSGEASVLRVLPPDPVIFDVGAHHGEYALFALKERPDAQLHCFEPFNVNYAILENSMAWFASWSEHRKSKWPVFTHEYGLSERGGMMPLYTPNKFQDSGLTSVYRRRLDHFGIAMKEGMPGLFRTLDDVMSFTTPHIKKIDLLKLDIEGHELSALFGSRGTIGADKVGLVQFEFGGCNIDSRTFLQDFYYFFKDYGMQIARILPTGLWLEIEPYREIYEQFRTSNYVAYKPF